MGKVKVIEIQCGIYERNNQVAAELRSELKNEGVCLINLMSSPGSGKTSTLLKTLAALKDEMKIGVMEADVDSDVDAEAVSELGVDVLQLHTCGACHTDAEMVTQCVKELGVQGKDLLFLENIGNLICTAGYDLGQNKNVLILSVPEGHDKPLKYPGMFEVVDLILVNKIDVMPYFDFDLEKFRQYVRKLNPKASILPISAKTGEGMQPWFEWLRKEVAQAKG
ncbi:MAG: hydrogenase nickel incorporation protein HypB [Anaerolineaceae bacterium]|nr:hydrogenase nickel incorporation protein HypB [Anaerolineaceae bacterium]